MPERLGWRGKGPVVDPGEGIRRGLLRPDVDIKNTAGAARPEDIPKGRVEVHFNSDIAPVSSAQFTQMEVAGSVRSHVDGEFEARPIGEFPEAIAVSVKLAGGFKEGSGRLRVELRILQIGLA